MVGFSPLAPLISRVFDCSLFLVEVQTLIFLFVFLPSDFIAIHLLDKYGLKFTLILGSLLLILGALSRLLVPLTGNFAVASIGSILAAIGQTCFYNCKSKLASTWFGDRERSRATTFAAISIPIGSLMGFVLPGIIVSEGVQGEEGEEGDEGSDDEDEDETRATERDGDDHGARDDDDEDEE